MRRINIGLMWFCKVSIIIMIPVMTIIIFIQVVMRYIFLSPFVWSEELARYLLIWISCLGSAYAVRKGEHISITFIKDKFPKYLQSLVKWIIHFVLIAFFAMGFVHGLLLSISEWEQLSPAMGIPMSWANLGITIGFGFMIMFGLELLTEDIKRILSAKALSKNNKGCS